MNQRQNKSNKSESKIQYTSKNIYTASSSPKNGFSKISVQNISPNNKRNNMKNKLPIFDFGNFKWSIPKYKIITM